MAVSFMLHMCLSSSACWRFNWNFLLFSSRKKKYRQIGDASSPHGATCIQYQMNSDGNTITAINSKSPSPSSPAGTSNEGLTRQQLDLISQIMQQTKQANGHKSTAQRPRTWNMQVRGYWLDSLDVCANFLDTRTYDFMVCFSAILKLIP